MHKRRLDRKRFELAAGMWLSFMAFVPYASGQALSDRPNILLIIADDLGYSDIGAFGGEIDTPNLDRLAENGAVFTGFHTGPSCTPTRQMLYSGVDWHRSGIRGGGLNENALSFATVLRDAGYYTVMTGKWGLGDDPRDRLPARGFERSFVLVDQGGGHFGGGFGSNVEMVGYREDGEIVEPPADFYSSDNFATRLIELLYDEQRAGRPYLGILSFVAPHWPFHARSEYIDKYSELYANGWDEWREARFEATQRLGLISESAPVPERLPSVVPWSELPAEQQAREARLMAIYAAMVDSMDFNIGRVLEAIERSGDAEDTVIIFMSDNGAAGTVFDGVDPFPLLEEEFDNSLEAMGGPDSFVYYGPRWAQISALPLTGLKGSLGEGGIRSPMIISAPRLGLEGELDGVFASVLDLAPTLLDLAGVGVPGGVYGERDVLPMEGRSMLPFLRGEADSVHPETEGIGFAGGGSGALFMDSWKILRKSGEASWALYDYRTDPGESADLSLQHPEVLQRMLNLYTEFEERNGIDPGTG